MGFDIFITLLFVALNGFFVAAEFAIVKVRLSQIEVKIREGNKMAVIAKSVVNKLDAYLSATQLGITLASLGLGWIGESVVSELIINLMHSFGADLSEETAHQISFPIAFALITVLHIVFGELAPKSIAIQRSEATTLATAVPLKIFYFMFKPFIWILNGFANFLLKLIGIVPGHGSEVHSPQELLYILEQSRAGGAIHTSEHEMLENVFDFYDRQAKQIMKHRTSIVAVDNSWPMEKIMATIANEKYTRYPVYHESIDTIVGLIHVKDILNSLNNGGASNINNIMREAFFVPDTKPIGKLLRDFQNKHTHLAIVIDEFGGVSGIITLEDIIEELVGEIQDEYDAESPWIEKHSDGSYHILAACNIIDANEQLPLPLPEGDDYETVGGYMNLLFGRVPDAGEKCESKDYFFEILNRSENHVEKVKAVVKHTPAAEPEE